MLFRSGKAKAKAKEETTAKDSRLGHPRTNSEDPTSSRRGKDYSKDPAWSRRGKAKAKAKEETTAKDSRLGHPHTNSEDPTSSRRGKENTKDPAWSRRGKAEETVKDLRLGQQYTNSKDPTSSRRGKDKDKETVKDSRLGHPHTNSKDLVRNQRGTDISIGQGNSRLGHTEKDAHTSDKDEALTSGAYKKVDKKVRPVPTTLPEEFRIVRRAHPNPLEDRKSTRLNSSHSGESRMPSSA